VTRNLGFSGLIRRTAPISRLLPRLRIQRTYSNPDPHGADFMNVNISLYYLYKCCIVCLFVCIDLSEQVFSYPAAVTITGDRTANSNLCFALMAFSSEGSFSCYTYCDAGPWFIRSNAKDRHARPTVGFEPGTQGSPDLCASALITAPRGPLVLCLAANSALID
jgi:hypothetical protein